MVERGNLNQYGGGRRLTAGGLWFTRWYTAIQLEGENAVSEKSHKGERREVFRGKKLAAQAGGGR